MPVLWRPGYNANRFRFFLFSPIRPRMSKRPDLLHLSQEALAQIANLGVVKRAVREMEGGYRPQLALDAEATLTASFADGIQTVWALDKPIQQTVCSCGAVNVCRHRIITALAFRAAAEAAGSGDSAAPVASPAEASDAALAKLIPRSVLVLAEQMLQQGLQVEVRRMAAGEPCDTARLPTATVRFWAGDALAAARCDCLRGSACEHVALGVWAFRKADAAQAASRVRLGAAGTALALDRAVYWALTDALLRHGVAEGSAPLAQAFSHALDAAQGLGAVWLAHLLRALEGWSTAYAARSALYAAEDGVGLLAELALRTAAGGLPGNARAVLGVGLPQETQLDRLRLMSLGARTQRDGEQRLTRLVLADVDTGTRLVLTQRWHVPQAQFAQEATLRSAERLAPGVRLEPLAHGQMLSQQAKRLADGSLKLAKARSAQNSVLPQAADWSVLGLPLRFERVAQLAEQSNTQPNAALLPRHAAGQFVVFSPAALEDLFYDPNSQTLAALLRDADGGVVLALRSYEGHLRHALDALAAGFSGAAGPLRHVAGLLRWQQGVAVIEPWALACERVIVPDFAPASGALASVRLGHLPDMGGSPLALALASLRSRIAELLHQGSNRLPRAWAEDSAALVRHLHGLGLHALAQRLAAVLALIQQMQANPQSLSAGQALLELLALAQLHEDALTVAGLSAA